MLRKFYLLLFVFLLSGCKFLDSITFTGSLHIYVKDQQGRNVTNATITGLPALPEATTDNFGSVLIKNLKVDTYELIASKAGYGSGKEVAMVKANEVVTVYITIQYGVYSSFAPSVKITLPVQPASFSADESILFKANVSDNDTPVESVDIRWESSVDGVLNTEKPNPAGEVSFSTAKLSRNTHVIRLIARDKSGNVGRDSLVVSTMAPKPITLDVPKKANGQVVLSWSKSDAPDFREYRIYRADKDCNEGSRVSIGVIQDPSVTTFTDPTPPFSAKACYFVEILTAAQMIRRSNQQSVDQPAGAFFDFVASDAAIHPTKPLLYLAQVGKDQVVVYDYEESRVVKEIPVPTLSGFILVGDNGNGVNLYVPCKDNSVLIYDAATFQSKKPLLAGAPATDVAISGTGTVFVSVSNQWTNSLSSFNEKSGMLLSSLNSTGCLYGGARLRRIPNQNTLMTISTMISPTDMAQVYFDDNGMILNCKSDSQHGSYPLDARIFRIAPRGDYVLTASNGAAYLCTESMKYLGQIPRGNLQFSDFGYNKDGSVFYGGTSNRPSIQIGKYPDLTRHDEILTRGYPEKIFVRDTKIISLSRTDLSSQATIVEIVNIP
jgi:hypothetical protein